LFAYIIELKTGRSYEELLQGMVFFGYRMSRSTSDWKKAGSHIVKGLELHGNELPNNNYNVLNGACAIPSTSGDLSRLVAANFSKDSVLLFKDRPPLQSTIIVKWPWVEKFVPEGMERCGIFMPDEWMGIRQQRLWMQKKAWNSYIVECFGIQSELSQKPNLNRML